MARDSTSVCLQWRYFYRRDKFGSVSFIENSAQVSSWPALVNRE